MEEGRGFLELGHHFLALYDRPQNCWGFPGGSDGKESTCNVRDLGSIPGWGRSGEGNSYPLQYSGLENSMDRGAWQATLYGVAKSWTQLSDFHFFRTVMAVVDVSLSRLMYYIALITRLPGVLAAESSAILAPVGSNQFLSYSS